MRRRHKSRPHRQDPLLLGPYARAVGPVRLADAAIEQLLPVLRAVLGQLLHVVLNIQQAAIICQVPHLDMTYRFRHRMSTLRLLTTYASMGAANAAAAVLAGTAHAAAWRSAAHLIERVCLAAAPARLHIVEWHVPRRELRLRLPVRCRRHETVRVSTQRGGRRRHPLVAMHMGSPSRAAVARMSSTGCGGAATACTGRYCWGPRLQHALGGCSWVPQKALAREELAAGPCGSAPSLPAMAAHPAGAAASCALRPGCNTCGYRRKPFHGGGFRCSVHTLCSQSMAVDGVYTALNAADEWHRAISS